MLVSRIATGVVVALLLTACSDQAVLTPARPAADGTGAAAAGTAASPGAPPPGESAAPSPDTAPAPAPAPAPRPVPPVLAEPAAGALKRVAFQAGDVISAAGAYFLDATTGAGEGWVHPDGSQVGVHFISADNRFVAAGADQRGYVIDRHSAAVWGWDTEHFRLLLATAGGFLFAEVQVQPPPGTTVETGRYFWTGPDFRPRQVFTLGGGGWGRGALLSPDGSRLALLRHGDWPNQRELALFDLDTGRVQRLDPPSERAAGAGYLRPHGEGFQVEWLVDAGDPSHHVPLWQYSIRRFNWQGEPVGDLRLPGRLAFFSPDGRWVAWEEWPVGDLASATVIADAGSLEPHLRALGTTPCFQMPASGGTRWLADSSGLVVDTAAGYRLLTLEGELREVPAFAGLNWKDEPQPAPDNVDRFAVGRLAVVNRAGTEALGITLAGYVTPSRLPPWGETSNELRFTLPPPPGHGACDERPPMPARVLLPARPLPAMPLVVRIADGCLSLRDRPRPYGAELACLPDGTRLAPVRVREDSLGIDWSDGSWWLSVKTEAGQVGWVSFAGDHVTWAES